MLTWPCRVHVHGFYFFPAAFFCQFLLLFHFHMKRPWLPLLILTEVLDPIVCLSNAYAFFHFYASALFNSTVLLKHTVIFNCFVYSFVWLFKRQCISSFCNCNEFVSIADRRFNSEPILIYSLCYLVTNYS